MEGKVKGANVADLTAILYAQTAKGAFKMGMFDSCEIYLKKGLELRKKRGNDPNLRIIIPIVKLKTQ